MTTKKKHDGWNVYPRRDGQWVLSYKDDSRVGKTWAEARIPRDEAHNERQAEAWALRFLSTWRELRGQRPTLLATTDAKTIRTLASKWLTLRNNDPRLSPSMRAQNKSNMNHHVLTHAIADVPIDQLGSGQLREWVRTVRDHGRVIREKDGKVTKDITAPITRREPLAPMTTRNTAGTLTQFFEDCMAEEWIALPANPMRHPGVRRELPEAETMAERRGMKRGEKAHLTRAQAEKLVTCAAVPELRRVLYLVGMTSGGFHPGELYGLTWADLTLDEKAPAIHITKALVSYGEKKKPEIGKTKTKDNVRTNPLHRLAARALRAWKKSGWMHLVGYKPEPTDLVFPNVDGKGQRPRDADNIRHDLAAAKLPTTYGLEHLTFTDCVRHTCATWLGAAGVTDEVIGRLLGHSARSVTRRHYMGDDLEALRAAVETITLDVEMGRVLMLPMAVAGGAPTVGLPERLLTSGKRSLSKNKPKVSKSLAPPRRLERLTNGLGIHRGPEEQSAPECTALESREMVNADDADACTNGARLDPRGKPSEGSAGKTCMQTAIGLLDANDVVGARALLASFLESS